jgi:Zn-finger nucleic acid-binding protein
MADATSLHCPNCGAPVDPELRRCPYCKARLATVSCPSCFALMFDGSEFCGACGARRARADAGADAAKCPDCKIGMHRLEIGPTPVLECERCDGVWVDGQTFERLCADREAQAAVLHQYAGHAAPSGKVKYRPCARCGKMMNRVNFARISGVVADVCKGHGTFLDPGELHAIVEFIHGGGLERSRARQIEELREQEQRALDAERRLAHERTKSGAHGGMNVHYSWTFMIDHGE